MMCNTRIKTCASFLKTTLSGQVFAPQLQVRDMLLRQVLLPNKEKAIMFSFNFGDNLLLMYTVLEVAFGIPVFL